MSDSHGPIFRSTTSILSISAAAALALAACAPDDAVEDEDATQEDTAQDDQTQDDQQDDSVEAEDTSDDADTDAPEVDGAADDDATAEEDTTEDDAAEASGDHPVYQALEAALAEYPDGVITEFEDNTNDGGYVEVFVYDGSTEWELEVDSETLEIIDTEDDGIDSDDEQEAQAVEIDIAEALQTAEEESGAEPKDGELNTEGGTVVWEFEMTNDVEVYVDVATGEVVKTDS
ncbi:hypothetical protein HGQ17_13395 [Nesterenkonia sp. MY13]|uniref:PepSY domain-containing protein n=1 Tax=Nesterenkonia sedimenti TaxID=1463632 RepID=A0A7X8TLG8_9MICC|nr:PepSY domain-containing protein [Nesterenkonia sedimenti]NLS10971.1 hypothetical protein [Nesterenkonia sedimenti]